MRKIVLGMAVAAAALTSPALARDGFGYFGADIGLADPEDHDVFVQGVDNGFRVEEKDGFELGAFIGYDWGAIRTEAEVAYKEFDPDVVTAGSLGVPVFDATNPTSGSWELGGESRLTTAMANALFDIGGNEGVGFSVGVGAGRAWLDSFFSTAPYQTWLDDSDSALACSSISASIAAASKNVNQRRHRATSESSMLMKN